MSSKKVRFGIGASILGVGVGLGYLAKKKYDSMMKKAIDEIVYEYIVKYPSVTECLDSMKASEIMDVYLAITELRELDGYDSTIPLHIMLGNVETAMMLDESLDLESVKYAIEELVNFEAKLIARENMKARFTAKANAEFSKFMNEPSPFGCAYDSDFEDECHNVEEPADGLKDVSEDIEIHVDLDEDTAFKEPTEDVETEAPVEEEAPAEEVSVEETVSTEEKVEEETPVEEEKPAEN